MLLGVLAAGGFWLHATAKRPLHLQSPLTFEIERGMPFAAVVGQLNAEGVLDQPWRVRLWGRLRGAADRIHAGEYRVRPGASVGSLLERLVQGEVLQRQVTLIEGWTLQDVRAALAKAPKLGASGVELADAALMQALGYPGQRPEGRFFPDTYRYTSDNQALDVLARAHARMQRQLCRAWVARDAGLPYGSPYEALITASLIEKETGIAGERDNVAAVFVNRLERGMRLQTDPSVIYGLGPRFDGNLTRAHLRDPHPWNTYVHRGLPPTPIAMPGQEAIHAALHPAPTDALYFVARGDGTTVFSTTLEAHRQAVRRFQTAPEEPAIP